MPIPAKYRRARLLLRSVTLGACAVFLTACTSTQPPRLSVSNVTISEENERAMVLLFALEGENPNNYPVPLGEVRYRLELEGREVFRGVRSAQVTLPRDSRQSIGLPAAFEFARVGLPLDGPTSYRFTGEVLYRPDGIFPGVLFDSDVHRPSASFSTSGTLDFSPATRTGPFQEDQPAGISVN